MLKRTEAPSRCGTILPLLAVSLIALFGFVALAVDVGGLAVGEAQCQNAADLAAVAGARTLTTGSTANQAAATTNAQNAAIANLILGKSLTASEIAVTHGAYHYNPTSQTFAPQFPPSGTDNYGLTQVTITHQVPATFSRVFGLASSPVTATATAAYRPRDVAIVLDYSGSMNNESDLWNCESYLGSMENTPNNTDPIFPQFGPYNPAFSAKATLQCTSADPRVGMCNVTCSVLGVPAMVNDFYQNNFGAGGVSGFTPAANTCNAPVAGDNYLTVGGTCVLTWSDAVNPNSSFFPGYSNFKGYTEGPGYWGKTFFLWPPQPTSDWRKLYFELTNGSPLNDNTQLWNSSGIWNNPSGNYIINYKAILNWIKNIGPNPFPPQLRAGNILYYSSIPSDVPAAAYNPTQPNSNINGADGGTTDQRFWKEYIDYVIGVWMDPFGNVQNAGSPTCSYGPDFTAGNGKAVQISGPDYKYKSGYSAFIDPNDNPKRPRQRLWFGPMTMIQYMSDTGLLPGTTHDISMIAAKLGVAGALQDIQNNHPNDLVSLAMFSRPPYNGEPTAAGQFAYARNNLSGNYSSMINSLWFPPNSGSADVRPWDTNGQQTPCAHGDFDSNTATDYGMMLAYNQLSSSTTLQTAAVNGQSVAAGGFGRKGAQKIVILETDGMVNQASSATFTNSGSYNSYYNLAPLGTVSASGAAADTSALAVATRICAQYSDNVNGPGYATPTKPVLVYCIAFGAIFEPTASGGEQASAVSFLQSLATTGGTTFPSSSTDPTYGYLWCIGTLSQRQAKLQQAFINIMDQTESIILVK
jgi:Flp pilus assembly protein TadG